MGPKTHPAIWHMLDVAAVAQHLLEKRPIFSSFSQQNALIAFVALHDLGKISEAFRDQINGKPAHHSIRHWQLSYYLLQTFDDVLGDCFGGNAEVRNHLAAAVSGHHGGPPEPYCGPRFPYAT